MNERFSREEQESTLGFPAATNAMILCDFLKLYIAMEFHYDIFTYVYIYKHFDLNI